jgi:hypothetical protein
VRWWVQFLSPVSRINSIIKRRFWGDSRRFGEIQGDLRRFREILRRKLQLIQASNKKSNSKHKGKKCVQSANSTRTCGKFTLPLYVILFDDVFGFFPSFSVCFEELVEFFSYVFFAFAAQDFSASASAFPLR